MSYEYLRLYTNAFAFQAAISQAIVRNSKTADQHHQKEHLRATFSNVASMSDARFIYESLDAARSYLDILVSLVNPEEHLRFMPLRYYLYSIYAAVFLYKVCLPISLPLISQANDAGPLVWRHVPQRRNRSARTRISHNRNPTSRQRRSG